MKKLRGYFAEMRTEMIQAAGAKARPNDPIAMQEFAKKLKGIGHCYSDKEAIALLPPLTLPGDYYHVRYTIYEVTGRTPKGDYLLAEPIFGGMCIQHTLELIDIETIIRNASCNAGSMGATSMGPGIWLETFALPEKDRGVMELGLVVEPFEQNDKSDDAILKANLRHSEAIAAAHYAEIAKANGQ